MHHAQDANAVWVDPIHKPILVDERLASVWILEFRDHAEGMWEVDKTLRGAFDPGDDPLRVGRRITGYVIFDLCHV